MLWPRFQQCWLRIFRRVIAETDHHALKGGFSHTPIYHKGFLQQKWHEPVWCELKGSVFQNGTVPVPAKQIESPASNSA